jgi:hypothetical protein
VGFTFKFMEAWFLAPKIRWRDLWARNLGTKGHIHLSVRSPQECSNMHLEEVH